MLIEKVLVVDDTRINRVVAAKQLAKLGIACDLAESGAEALALVAGNSYSALLVDISMPEMDGLEFTRRFRDGEGRLRDGEAGRDRRTPVIGVTGHVGAEDRKRMLDAGMDDALAKPLDVDTLAATLERWCGSAGNVAASRPAIDQALGDPTPAGPVPIDLERLSEMLGTDDNDEMSDMLSLLTEEFSALLPPLEEALAARDVRALHDAAHKAKGAANSAAALPLADLLGGIESDAGSGDWGDLGIRIADARDEYGRVERFCRDRGSKG